MDVLRHLLVVWGWKTLYHNPGALGGRAPILWSYDREHEVKVDFALTFMEYQRQALRRVRRFSVGRLPGRFACLEDVLVHSIHRGSARDMADCRELLRKNPPINRRIVQEGIAAFERIWPKSSDLRWNALKAELSGGRPLEKAIDERREELF